MEESGYIKNFNEYYAKTDEKSIVRKLLLDCFAHQKFTKALDTYSVEFETEEEVINFIGKTILGISNKKVLTENRENFAEKARSFLKSDGKYKMIWHAELLVIEKNC